jgi:hypothetical protein
MSQQQQQQQPQQQTPQPSSQIPIQDAQETLSEEGQRLVNLFTEMDSKQLDFLDESGKSLIERIATFLAVLFGVTVLGNTFPPPYLKGNLPAKVLVIVTLAFYITSMAAGILAIQPRIYRRYLHNVTRLGGELEKITGHKMRWLRIAGILFALGSAALATLIVFIIWNV